MTSQSCCKSLVEALEAQAFLLNDVSGITHSGWLLQRERDKARKIIFGNVKQRKLLLSYPSSQNY